MASATTMGLRRRAPVNSSPTPSSQSLSTTSSSSSKRSRSENNNSPSHGNLNSMNGGTRDEPPAKKSRGTSTSGGKGNSSSCPTSSSSISTTTSISTDSQISKSRGTSVSRSATQTKSSSTSMAASTASSTSDISNGSVLSTSWPTTSNMSDVPSYASVTGLGLTGGQTAASLCAGSLGMPPTPIPPYMSTSMATFVGNATNLGKNSSVSYLDISNMTSGSLAASGAANSLNGGYAASGTAATVAVDAKGGMAMSYTGMSSPNMNGGAYGVQKGQGSKGVVDGAAVPSPRKFQNDAMYDAYQPWVIKTYGDLAKTKTITIKKYGRILRTLRGEEVNSAENSKFRFWVKSKGFHIGQPEGYDAKAADRIIGRHAVTSPGLDPPLYVPTQLPHNKVSTSKRINLPPVSARDVPQVESTEATERIKLASAVAGGIEI